MGFLHYMGVVQDVVKNTTKLTTKTIDTLYIVSYTGTRH